MHDRVLTDGLAFRSDQLPRTCQVSMLPKFFATVFLMYNELVKGKKPKTPYVAKHSCIAAMKLKSKSHFNVFAL